MAVFTNRATLSYNGNTVNSNTVTGNIIEVLSASKTALDSDYGANDQVTYVVSITNSGTTAFTGLTVNDNLGEYSFGTLQLRPLDYIDGSVAYFQNGVLQPAPVVTSTDPLIFSAEGLPSSNAAGYVTTIKTPSLWSRIFPIAEVLWTPRLDL